MQHNISLEDFYTLKESQSLDLQIQKRLEQIKVHERRSCNVQDQIKLKSQQYLEKKEKLKEIQKQLDLYSMDTSLTRSNEDHILSLMEEEEQLEKAIQQLSSFLQGSQDSLKEINQECIDHIKEENQQIHYLELRIQSLLDSCPPILKNYYTQINKKHRFKNPLTNLTLDNSCEKCHLSVSKQEQILIHQGQHLCSCRSCGRIFLPTSL